MRCASSCVARCSPIPRYLGETLPPWTREPRRLWGFAQAVHFLHEPPPEAANAAAQASLDQRTHPAWTRLKFDELLAQQLSLKMHRRARARRKAPRLPGDGSLTRELLARLPFTLTRAQQRVIAEIRRDLARAEPMQRLLQGDVGSGKTIVAALAALQAIESGYQVAFMAPTEILAEQHYRKLAAWLDGLPLSDRLVVRRPAGEGAQEGARGDRRRRGAARDRHARAVPGRGRAAEAGPGHRRRAAPLRRRAKACACGRKASATRTS